MHNTCCWHQLPQRSMLVPSANIERYMQAPSSGPSTHERLLRLREVLQIIPVARLTRAEMDSLKAIGLDEETAWTEARNLYCLAPPPKSDLSAKPR